MSKIMAVVVFGLKRTANKVKGQMILTKLFGGLGNQMFQYAAGRNLAMKHNTDLKFDLSWYAGQSNRIYEMDKYNIHASLANSKDFFQVSPRHGILDLVGNWFNQRMRSYTERAFRSVGVETYNLPSYCLEFSTTSVPQSLMIGKIASQRYFHYDKEFESCPENTYLVGYWISYKYFQQQSCIRDELTLKCPLGPYATSIARIISSGNSVSIHLRRGDKLNDPQYRPTDIGYVLRSIDYIEKRISDPIYFVFSDDIDWVKSELPINQRIHFIENESEQRDTEDLHLMSLCKHNIIAESSYSWWGAWLNRNPEKLVVSPVASNWINAAHYNTEDILPPEWEVID